MADSEPNFSVEVTDSSRNRVPSATVMLTRVDVSAGTSAKNYTLVTNDEGVAAVKADPGTYNIDCNVQFIGQYHDRVTIQKTGSQDIKITLDEAALPAFSVTLTPGKTAPTEGEIVEFKAEVFIEQTTSTAGGTKSHKVPAPVDSEAFQYKWLISNNSALVESVADQDGPVVHWNTANLRSMTYVVNVQIVKRGTLQSANPVVLATDSLSIPLMPRPTSSDAVMPVSLRRTSITETDDQALWAVIRSSTNALGFNNYRNFIDPIMCGQGVQDDGPGRSSQDKLLAHVKRETKLPFPRVDGYKLLKAATEVFLTVNCGVLPNFDSYNLSDESRRFYRPVGDGEIESLFGRYMTPVGRGSDANTIPYLDLIQDKLGEVRISPGNTFGDACYGILQEKLTNPCFLELIWSYWHEEAFLVQTMNAISLRFQNRRCGDRDPLAQFELDPLRPLNNLVWGYIQDEQHRLTIPRRAYEYDHHYGMTLAGKAVPKLRSAESRSKFLEAFHNLLQLCSVFLKEDDDTTVIADGFPVLNALKDVHMLLTQGMHNQYGDLPWTARQEMLMQQWLLSRPEMREFLPSRIMVAYPEAWMDRVETMKKLQAWSDLSVTHFRDLGVFGEQILLGIRFGAWSKVNEPEQAANWLRYWRPEIQGYMHSYRAVTGVDLTADTVDTRQAAERYLPPSIHIQKRIARSMEPVNGAMTNGRG